MHLRDPGTSSEKTPDISILPAGNLSIENDQNE